MSGRATAVRLRKPPGGGSRGTSIAPGLRFASPRRLLQGVIIGSVMRVALLWSFAFADEVSIPRIAVLVRPTTSPMEEGVRDGLRELGYAEGKNIAIEWRRTAGGQEEWLIASDLARSKLDTLIVFSTGAARAALEASPTVPIVFASGDPVGAGLAASLAKPGRNATGVSVISTELFPKRLEYLHRVAPRARRIAFLTNSANPAVPPAREATQKAARALGLKLIILAARNEAELDAALRSLQRGAADGIIVAGDALFFSKSSTIIDGIARSRLPAIFPYVHDCDHGVLMCYGPNVREVGRKMAVYVDRILKGAKPADLPIEQVSNYELIVNLRVAKELKLDVPHELLLRANEVIR